MEGVPYVFGNDKEGYVKWRESLALRLGVDASEIQIIGSAAIGVSLSPYKNFKTFSKKSDVDVAIVSEHFFNISWRFLRGLGSERHSFSPPVKRAIEDHVSKYVYWGTIATERLLPYLPFGKKWIDAFNIMSQQHPLGDRVIKARIYKDLDSLRAYHVRNLRNLRDKELEKDFEK
jgi:hypothetical protein